MEKGPPSWLNKEFLTEVLKDENAQQQLEVQQFTAKLAVGAGNNYLSQIYRVSVEYKILNEEKSTSLIIKVPLSNGYMAEMQSSLFETEPVFYRDVLPVMEKLAGCQFGPKLSGSSQGTSMVLQDLKSDGFLMGDRFKRLDLPHCKVVFKAIAKFHASSVACYNENPDLINSVAKERMFPTEDPMRDQKKLWLKELMMNLSGMITATGGSKEEAELLSSRSEQITDNVEKICQSKVKGLNVLNHGDLWTNNLLFKYDENSEIVDMRFIDFQLTRFTSPVLDLLYFVWTSATLEVCEHHLKELFSLYLTILNDTLERIGCEERMREDEFKDDLENSLDFAIIITCQVLPFITCEAENVVNLEDIKTEELESGQVDEKFKKVYSGKSFVSIFPTLIKHLNSWVTSPS